MATRVETESLQSTQIEDRYLRPGGRNKSRNFPCYGTFAPKKYVLVNEYASTISQRQIYSQLLTIMATTGSAVEDGKLFFAKPLLGPLVFENKASDARDHCANERNFLSWLRLSIYLAVVAVAILTTFHFNSQPTKLEQAISFPLGMSFWLLSLISLFSGLGNYLKTVQKYSRQTPLVQTGWRTQLVGPAVS